MVLPARHARVARLLPGAAACAALIAVWCLATTRGPTADASITDLPIYEGYAHLLSHGLVPYRDFLLEYPPLALAPFWLGDILGDAHYALAFGGLMLVCALATLLATAALAGDGSRPAARGSGIPAGCASRAAGDDPGGRAYATAAWALALSPLAAGALVRTHFDFLPAALTALALLAFARERPRVAFALLGLGTLAKLYPALLAPVALVWLLARGERRAAAQGLALFAAVLVVGFAPFAGSGLLDGARFQTERPVQIESTPASVLFAVSDPTITGTPQHPDRFRSQGVRDPLAPAVSDAALALLALALLAAYARARERPDPRWLVRCSFAAVLAFVALGKVLSPQYVIWLLPFAALAWAWRERALALLTTLAVILTQLEFPARYWDLVAGDGGVIALVAARNALLLAALAVLLAGDGRPLSARAARGSAAARSSRRGAARSP